MGCIVTRPGQKIRVRGPGLGPECVSELEDVLRRSEPSLDFVELQRRTVRFSQCRTHRSYYSHKLCVQRTGKLDETSDHSSTIMAWRSGPCKGPWLFWSRRQPQVSKGHSGGGGRRTLGLCTMPRFREKHMTTTLSVRWIPLGRLFEFRIFSTSQSFSFCLLLAENSRMARYA